MQSEHARPVPKAMRAGSIVRVMRRSLLTVVAIALLLNVFAAADEVPHVGPAGDGGTIVSTQQLIRPAGKSLEYKGRPVDLVLAPDHKTAYVLSNASVLAIDTVVLSCCDP